MTNEEAKNLIDRWVVITLIEGGVSLSERTRQALDMAIKALEHCGDAISRDAVLDACSQSYGILDAMGRIEELPSVNPKQMVGRWIDEGYYADGSNASTYRCSVCGGHIIEYEPDRYCKFCGAKMEEQE